MDIDPERLGQSIRQKVGEALDSIAKGLEPTAGGVIEDQGVLDLTSAQKPEDIRHIRVLRQVGVVLVPEHLVGELARARMERVGAVVPVPAGGRRRLYTGQLKLAGDAFAEGTGDDVVVLVGQVVFTSPVTEISVRQLVVVGQILAPRSSERALSRAVTHLTGQVAYYPDGGTPRILTGQDRLEQAFFERLAPGQVLLLVGSYDFADDVRPETLDAKLAGLVIVGKATCAAALKPVLQAMCSECVGTIEAR